jgi:protein CrcB
VRVFLCARKLAGHATGAFASSISGDPMLTYFYIALGGAIGSVARAWTTNAMVRMVGAGFPWGTILINVVGSFIIGFFGALTASDGRFQVHGDARAFVMIGICGGYTTFSSFSLQTLDLIRDGKPGAAFANIGLSVLLCLLAVSAGYASAMAFNNGSARTEAYEALKPGGARAMGEVALAVLDRPETVGSVLSSAARLLQFGAGGRIEALAVRTPPVAEIMLADQSMSPVEEERFRTQEHDWADAVKATVSRWEPSAKGIQSEFIETEGDIAHIVAERGRRSDVVVVPGGEQTERSRDALHAAIFDTSRAVLVAARQCTGEFGRVVAIAWKDDVRAQKAVLAAMPLLEKADAIHVLRAKASNGMIPPILDEHGIQAQIHAVDGHGPVGEQLLQKAHELGADLFVMGAYAHGEWREALLGGVTRYMLDHADLPLLMRH